MSPSPFSANNFTKFKPRDSYKNNFYKGRSVYCERDMNLTGLLTECLEYGRNLTDIPEKLYTIFFKQFGYLVNTAVAYFFAKIEYWSTSCLN